MRRRIGCYAAVDVQGEQDSNSVWALTCSLLMMVKTWVTEPLLRGGTILEDAAWSEIWKFCQRDTFPKGCKRQLDEKWTDYAGYALEDELQREI